jgi:hypothetical protein
MVLTQELLGDLYGEEHFSFEVSREGQIAESICGENFNHFNSVLKSTLFLEFSF